MFVRVNRLDMHVQLRGASDAPALVLLHSLGTNLHLWDAQAEALSDHFQVIQPDLRGHGLTTVPNGPYAMTDLATDIDTLLSVMGVDRAHVVGISPGGAVALALAVQSPPRLHSLALCDTAASFQPSEFWLAHARTARSEGLESFVAPSIARWVGEACATGSAAAGLRAMLRRTDPEGFAAASEALASFDLEEACRQLRLPTLVLVGENDQSTPVATARRLSASSPDAILTVRPGLSHLPPMEAPRLVTETLRGFLDTPR